MNELAKVSRFEVIDHRENGKGRAMVVRGHNLKIETSLQDSNRTLKVFINDTKAPIPINRAEINQLYAYTLLRESSDGKDIQLDNLIKSLGEYINRNAE